MSEAPSNDHATQPDLARRHIRLGWWLLLLFVTLGATLEGFHGFKSDWYLNLDHEVRRMAWRLAHASGTVLALLHLAFGFSVYYYFRRSQTQGWKLASPLLTAGSLLIPTGLLLGGAVLYEGRAGPAILLVPAGALLLLIAVLLTARATLPNNGSVPD